MDYELPPDEPSEGAPDWIVTFADLMSLLMCFFVLLLSFSNLELMKFKSMAGSVRHAFGAKPVVPLSNVPMGESLLPYQDPKEGEGGKGTDGDGVEEDPAAKEIREGLERVLESAGLKGRAVVRQTRRGVSLHIQGDLLFDSGSAELKREAFPVLERLAAYSMRVQHDIDVQGHSDSVPISTSLYPSNWELSAARAGRAVRHLTDAGVPARRLRAIGLADAQPVDSNDTPQGRMNNRRVEFTFVRPVERSAPVSGFVPAAPPDSGNSVTP